MKSIPLSQFCEIVQGGRLKFSGADFVEHGFPAYGAGGINGYLPRFEFDREAVVLSAIGARCGKCFYASGQWASLANTQLIFTDPSKADAKFIWFQLNDESRWPRSGTGQPFIKPSDVKRQSVYLPSLEEQQRIVAILDQADDLRLKRRLALQKLNALRESLYQDLALEAGVDNWPRVTIGELATIIRTGPFGSQLLHSEFVDDGIAVLGIDNTRNNEFSWSQRRFITPNKYKELTRYTVRPGDVLITIMGTCGRSAIVPDSIPLAINTKHLCCITLDQGKCLPELLHAALIYDREVLAHLGVRERGAVMPGLNMQLIKETPLRLPPLSIQKRFAEKRSRSLSLEARQKTQLEALEALFASLQRRAFSGELLASSLRSALAV